MPNECEVILTITGERATIFELSKTQLDFPTYLPIPDDVDDAHEWAILNWGCRSNRTNFIIHKHGLRGLKCSFTTAWTPPYTFLYHLLKTYPDLWIKAEWHEEGGFAGVWIGQGGLEEGPLTQSLEWQDLNREAAYFDFMTEEELEKYNGANLNSST